MSTTQSVPEGRDFLRLIWGQEDDCEVTSDKKIDDLGEKAPACLSRIGTALSCLDRMASCWYGCSGGDHIVEYLCGRVASNARAGLRLTRLGFYDETLLLCRTVGETANLMQLFVFDPDALAQWKILAKQKRMKQFSPVKVRHKLTDLSSRPLIDHERYRMLCERSAHVQPDTKPQTHNILGIPIAGSSFQEAGMVVCLNELARPLSGVLVFGARLLNLEANAQKNIRSVGRNLVEAIGGATIDTIDDYSRQVRDDSEMQKTIMLLSDLLRRSERSFAMKRPIEGREGETQYEVTDEA